MKKAIMRTHVIVVLLAMFGAAPALAQHQMPAGMSHEEHQRELALKARGAAAMGFDQDRTTHHFILTSAGGAIVVTANESSDTDSIEAVRTHLQEIASAFSHGDFAKPFATHGEVPPGVRTMTERQDSLTFRYEPRESGGAVVVTTRDAVTRGAIHDFLRYQIVEHKTGDSLTPKP